MEKSFIKFKNLAEYGLINKDGAIDEKNPNVQLIRGFAPEVDLYSILNTPYFVKRWRGEQSVQSIASAKMYDELGIPTPPVYVFKTEKKYPHFTAKLTATQDVTSATGLVCKLGEEIFKKSEIFKSCYGKFKWEVLFNSHLKQQLLKIMSPECLDEFVDYFLLGEIRADGDCHYLNYFLVKSAKSERYEHLVPIDLEMSQIQRFENTFTKNGFENFVYANYSSAIPHSIMHDNLPYVTRIKEIAIAIDDGAFGAKSINLLKRALEYDFPKAIYAACMKFGENKIAKKQQQAYERLWEFNRNELGEKIGL